MPSSMEKSAANVSGGSDSASTDNYDTPSARSVQLDVPGITKTQQRLQVLSTAIVFMNTWGILLAFGAFQTYYQQVLLKDHSSSDITWISTTSAFILMGSGLITGPLYDRGWLRTMTVAGSILEAFGLMMISLSSKYYQVFLAQGIVVGLGTGLVYIPGIAAVGAMFEGPKRAKIIGLISAASGIGGVFYPIMFHKLLNQVGFGWAVRAIGFVVFGTYLFAWGILPYPPRDVGKGKVRAIIDPTALTDLPFVSTSLLAFFGAMAYYIPLLYLPIYAETAVSGFPDADLAFYLLSILNGASVLGRFGAGFLAMKIGPVGTCGLAALVSFVILFAWISVHSTAGIIVWSAFWGATSSIIVALPGAIVPLFTPSIDLLGTRNGMMWFCAAVGTLIGAPIAGALIDSSPHSSKKDIRWWPLQIFAGFCMLLAALAAIPPILALRRRKMVAERNAEFEAKK